MNNVGMLLCEIGKQRMKEFVINVENRRTIQMQGRYITYPFERWLRGTSSSTNVVQEQHDLKKKMEAI